MKKLLLITIFILSFSISNAQDLEWVKDIYNFGTSLTLDNSKNILLANTFTGTHDFDPGPGVYNLTAVGGYDVVILKLDSLGNLLWVRTVGSTSDERPGNITTDNQGNIYINGVFDSIVDFDPGNWSFELTSNGSTDAFIMKLDAAGNFIWAKSIGNNNGNSIRSLVVDLTGIYYTGQFLGTLDLDPNSGVFNLQSGTGDDVFVSKLDFLGNLVWAKKFGGSYYGTPSKILLDNLNNVYTIGSFYDVFDFDPGPGTYNLSSPSNTSGFISKLDAGGNFVGAWQLTSTGTFLYGDASMDANGFLYITGSYNGTIDCDPGSLIFPIASSGTYSSFLIKVDTGGTLIWADNLNSGTWIASQRILNDSTGNVYLAGDFKGSADFNPGPSVDSYTSAGINDIFLLKFNSSGNYIWGTTYGGSGDDAIYGFCISPQKEIFSSGIFSDTVDFDPGSGVSNLFSSGQNGFLTKLSQDLCSNMLINIDSISNIGCAGAGVIYTHAENGTSPYIYAWNTIPATNDSIAIISQPGIYELTLTDANNCLSSSSVFIDGILDTLGYDLKASYVSSSMRQGIVSYLWVNALNERCTPVSGQLQLVLSPVLDYNNAIPVPDSIYGNVLIWNFNSLTYDAQTLNPIIQVTPQIGIPDDYYACSEVKILPLDGDVDSSNNFKMFCTMVTNSHDPNIINVHPTGACIPGYIENQLLTYSIQFQNTGSADAINIFVLDSLDSLDSHLNINTLHVIGNSHPVITEVLPGNVLKFKFDNIHLADSTSDEPNSHGYIIYEISPASSLTNGTEISNKAGIYFDFNEPVYTNTVLNTIIDIVPIDCSIAGIPEKNIISNSLFIYPNPANNTISTKTNVRTEIRILNILGETVILKEIEGENLIDISNLSNGIYIMRTKDGLSQKLIKQ